MKNYTSIKIPKKLENRRNFIAVLILVALPIILGGVYVAQQLSSEANVISEPTNFLATRDSETSATVSFDTAKNVKATILCADTVDGVKFFCGEDPDATTDHSISTADFNVNLNTGQGYYVFSNIIETNDPIGFIPADTNDPAFGLSTNFYNEETLGLCWGEEGYDPQLDVDQDGCVYTSDLVQLYE